MKCSTYGKYANKSRQSGAILVNCTVNDSITHNDPLTDEKRPTVLVIIPRIDCDYLSLLKSSLDL